MNSSSSSVSLAGKRICVVTAGHLSTCPRMLKAADTLQEAGYRVRVVSANYVPWAREADAYLRQSRSWAWSVFDYEKSRASFNHFKTGLRYHLARKLARVLGPERTGLALAARAYSRAHPELFRLAVSEPADFIYGGTGVGISVAAAAARRLGVPFALDLEDYHSAEQDESAEARLAHSLVSNIERRTLRDAAFLTAGSEAIAAEYRRRYGVAVFPLNNVFPLPARAPDFSMSPAGELRFVWLSQTVGGGRGLEEAVEAIGLADIAARLTLRGTAAAGYLESFREFAKRAAPRLQVEHFPPSPSADVVDLCRGNDIGLALEQAHVLNRALCLCNKPFTYLLAGLAVVFTDTPGQRPLAEDLGGGALFYKIGEARQLAAGLKAWADDPEALLKARRAAWDGARRRWHWEHPAERGALLAAVAKSISEK
ncbi:MAG: hypothetical protein EXS35_10980 [Pedosphaera sp.]|nr:hypothetical protein [Pedosphaera sp.]